MRKRIVAFSLSLAMLVSMLITPSFTAESGASDTTVHWFYDQLSEQGQAIYDAIAKMYGSGMMKDGQTSYDLVAEGVVEASVVENYLEGNRTLFNDFAAAKDAFDLEHPEAWYFDSSELSFRVTSGTDGLHAYMGPGRTEDYYVAGVAGADDVESKTTALDKAIGDIVSGARGEPTDYAKIRYVHDKITHGISYRFETECADGNAGYLRTAYALVTHEGVCEGYARSFQYVLNKLSIPCVLIHGVQTSGEPEEHMWCAVRLEGEWYVVDPTWDDPVTIDADGKIKKTGVNGSDGGENETYLLVGQNIVGANWQPSGYVSTSVTAFEYPEIALMSYGSGVVERSGLKVEYASDTMEGGQSTVYHVSFNGDGLVKAAEKGYYFLVKMYDVNADGSVDEFEDWYYSVHGLHLAYGNSGIPFDPNNKFQDKTNPYLGDTDEYLIYNVINCEYVEFAITTKAPPAWESADDLLTPELGGLGGYYEGDYSDILAETGLILNVNGGYEQPPYVKNVSPALTSSITAGKEYTIHIEFTDPLYHPSQESIDKAVADGLEDKLEKAPEAMDQKVTLDYCGTTYSWGMNGGKPHEFTNKPDPQNVRWVCETHGTHTGFDGIGDKCRLTTLEYEFTSSTMWADDSCMYEFYLTGLVGVKSNKFPNHWGYVFENKYPFWTCPLYSGYTWNLWAQPQILDNPEDLDFDELVVRGVDGVEQSLSELHDSMNLDDNDMNGRIVLSVQNIGESRSRTEELAEAISESEDVEISEDAVLGSSLFEIDFARICRCTVVETGQTLRLCVGFPPGIDASMAGVVFKAYHFTRDIEKSCKYDNERYLETHPDDNTKPADHVHTGEIYSVEEIPITVTPYGLVITCSSFSPFEIVALDASKAEGVRASDDHYVILTDDGNGEVTSDGGYENGMVKFEASGDNAEHTFTVVPKEGYALDTISFGGEKKIEVKDGQFTLKYADVEAGSAILNVTFVPEEIKQAEEERGETVETPVVCNHVETTKIDAVEATCTKAGHTAGLECGKCHMVLVEVKEIPMLDHTFVDGVCSVCGAKDPEYDDPTPSDPIPSDPVPSDPVPSDPVPSDPVPSDPVPSDPVPSDPTPSDPTPDDPAPSDPSQPVNGASGSAEGGSWTADVSSAVEGDTVTVTSEADSGYISVPVVTDEDGNSVAVVRDAGGAWSFTMPKGGVTVAFTYTTPAGMFGDLSDSEWYREDIAYAVENGLMQGVGDGNFNPVGATTRGMVMTILARQSGVDTTAGEGEPWYQKGMEWARETGVSDGNNPGDNITREQLAAMLWRFVDRPEATGDLSAYPDAGDIHADWAGEAMLWAVQTGIVKGGDGKLNPLGNASRAEAAAMISRFCRNLKDGAGQ